MAQKMGLLGKKIGMTQVFAEDGECVPVTVIQTGPCYVVGKRTADRDGYVAIVLGFDEKPPAKTAAGMAVDGVYRFTNRAQAGEAKAAGVKPQRFIRELRIPAAEADKLEVGQALTPGDVFKEGGVVDVTGISKGKGYQGVIKRHHMSGMTRTHGTHEYYRHGGSIGCRLTPQRVHKGKRMAGHMGDERVTIQNLQLLRIVADENCILVRGAIPGSTNAYVIVSSAATRTAYKRKGVGKEEVRSKNPLKASKKAAAGRA